MARSRELFMSFGLLALGTHAPLCILRKWLPPQAQYCSCMSCILERCSMASLAQLAEHALRKRTVVGSIPTGGLFHQLSPETPTRNSHQLQQRMYLIKAWRRMMRARILGRRSFQKTDFIDSSRYEDHMTVCRDGLEIYWALPAGVRNPPLSLCVCVCVCVPVLIHDLGVCVCVCLSMSVT